jgi:hypothetical protein
VWDLGNGNYLLDDVDFQPQFFSGGRTMEDYGPPAPPGAGGGGEGGTNSSGGGSSAYVFPTNGLWLQITGITNGVACLTLNNGTDYVY